MGRIRRRDILAIVAIALVSGLLGTAPLLERVHGLSLDILTALRWELYGAKRDVAASPTVVVAIDEETYQTLPFKNSPTLTWTREIGRVLNAIVEGTTAAIYVKDLEGRYQCESRGVSASGCAE